jgi:hypothetical protein
MQSDDEPKPEQLEAANEAWLREQHRSRPTAPHPLMDQKTTAPPEMRGMTPREAARLGIWSDGGPPGVRRRYPYSKT